MSPLSDSTVLAASCARVNLLDHVKHMFYSTVPAMLVSLVLFFVLGFKFKDGAISGADYDEILAGLDASFNLNLLNPASDCSTGVGPDEKNLRFLRLGGNCCRFCYRYCDAGADPMKCLTR